MESLESIKEHFGLGSEDLATARAIHGAKLLQDAGDGRAAEQWLAATEGHELKLFHGTSWDVAQKIQAEGFQPSEEGCLGRGVYVARRDKALKFAQDALRHGGDDGGLVTAVVSFQYPKFLDGGDDDEWQLEGYDACRTPLTSRSENMEWCLKDASQLRVTRIERIELSSANGVELAATAGPRMATGGVEADGELSSANAGAELAATAGPRMATGGVEADGELSSANAGAELAATAGPRMATGGVEADGKGGDIVVDPRWSCGKCGQADNYYLRPCSGCSVPMPEHAIAQAISVAEREMSEPHDQGFLATASSPRVAFKVGSLSGWAVGMDDAARGAPLPKAFAQTTLLVAPAQKKVFVNRTTGFNQAIDGVRTNPDAPPCPTHFATPPEHRTMPRKRLREAPYQGRSGDPFWTCRNCGTRCWEARHCCRNCGLTKPAGATITYPGGGGQRQGEARRYWDQSKDDDASSCASSSYSSLHPSQHARERAEQRLIKGQQMKRAIKHGVPEQIRTPMGAPRMSFAFDGLTVITDMVRKYAITAFWGERREQRYLFDAGSGDWFNLEEFLDEDHPPTPSARGSTPQRDGSQRGGSQRSRSGSRSRESAAGQLPPHRREVEKMGAIAEYARPDPDDVMEHVKARARLINDVALSNDPHCGGLLWTCRACETTNKRENSNLAWMRCLGCHADYPESEIKRLKESARKILDMPEDRATAERGNPLRHGVTAGYALGRCKAVAGSEDVQHPRAFADVALMPPPPPRDQCSLPNPRLITAGAALDRDGGGAWRDMLGS